MHLLNLKNIKTQRQKLLLSSLIIYIDLVNHGKPRRVEFLTWEDVLHTWKDVLHTLFERLKRVTLKLPTTI